RWLILRENAAGRPCMIYIHPYELGPEVPDVPGLSPLRRFRHYHGIADGASRMRRLLDGLRVGTAAQVLAERGPHA
ncbi:MAG: DUF3473 domain-containing protein, partial [Deltaproteobacteria bacterium]|nr:DUF3473 domain-containing protein [Deltaproteobacteria bacterium]